MAPLLGPTRRQGPTLEVERELLGRDGSLLVGLDEVGRGAIAGPVAVGAVVVQAGCAEAPVGLRDSKLLTAAARDSLVAPIHDWAAAYSVGFAQPEEIDEVGIIAALGRAARRALAELALIPAVVLLDGNLDYVSRQGSAPLVDRVRPEGDVMGGRSLSAAPTVHTRVKADRDCASVAAASVLAKTARDSLMVELAEQYPAYQWQRNKGYGTAAHRAAIDQHGLCEHHRCSWRISPSPLRDDGV